MPRLKFIEFGYYDGPVSGALECLSCGKTYAFDMLDWDHQHNVRIFGLTDLSRAHFEQYVRARASRRAQRDATPQHVSRKIEQAIMTILGRDAAGVPPDILLAWRTSDNTVVTARRVTDDEKSRLSWLSWDDAPIEPDWFPLLGLSKNS